MQTIYDLGNYLWIAVVLVVIFGSTVKFIMSEIRSAGGLNLELVAGWTHAAVVLALSFTLFTGIQYFIYLLIFAINTNFGLLQ